MRISKMTFVFCMIQLVLVLQNSVEGYCSQESAKDLAIRMQGVNAKPTETQTLLEYVANFTAAWIESNNLDEAHHRMFRGIEQQIRAELELLAPSLSAEEHRRITALAYAELKRDSELTPILESPSQRSQLVAARKSSIFREEVYERLYQEKFKGDKNVPKAYTVQEQEKRILQIFQGVDRVDPVVGQFFADLFQRELRYYGPNGLFRHAIFRELMHWSGERSEAIIFGFDYEAYESATIAPIKRGAMSDFLQTLTEPQREMLANKLGITVAAIPQFADITPASDLKRVFSESIGKLPINYSARNRLLSTSKSALAALRQFTATENADASETIQALQVVLKNLASFPPGEFGDLSELEAEVSQLKSDGTKELRAELSRLVRDFGQYQNDSAAPWKWPGIVDFNIQTSLGALDDDQLKKDVSISLKRAFCNLAPARSLESDPSESVLSCIKSLLDDDTFWFPGTELWKIRNSQVDHPRKYEFENHADRLAESKMQLALITEPLVPRQSAELSARYAQYLFSIYGPYNYFQRPDFAAEFKVTPEQQKQMDEVAKRISEKIEEQIHPVVKDALEKLFEQLSDEEKQSVEKLLDCKWNDVGEALLQVKGERSLREMMIDPCGPNFATRKQIPRSKARQ